MLDAGDLDQVEALRERIDPTHRAMSEEERRFGALVAEIAAKLVD